MQLLALAAWLLAQLTSAGAVVASCAQHPANTPPHQSTVAFGDSQQGMLTVQWTK